MTDQRDLDIERFLDGDPGLAQELLGRLGSDPELRRRLGRALLQDALLRQALQGLPAAARPRLLDRPTVWLAAAGILLAVAMALWFMTGRPAVPVVDAGAIRVLAAREASCDGHRLAAGDGMGTGAVTTGTSGLAELLLPGDDRIVVAPSSDLRIGGAGNLSLMAGSADCTVARHDPAAPFALAIPGAIAVAMGTRFSAAVPAQVTVTEGRVVLLSAIGDAATLIEAGQAAALTDTSAWYRFPADADLLAEPAETADRISLLLAARRQIADTGTEPVRLTVVAGADPATDLQRLARVQRTVQRCLELRLPVAVLLGKTRDLDRRIRAGHLVHLQEVLEPLLRLDPAVTVKASTALQHGTNRTSAEAIADLDQRCRAARGGAR